MKGPYMRPSWYQVCRLIMKLDWIPRYGRLYPLEPRQNLTKPLAPRKGEWCWQSRGRWGMNLLVRWGMFWDYMDEARYRQDLKTEKMQKMSSPDLRTQRREKRSLIAVGVLLLISAVCLVLSFTLL